MLKRLFGASRVVRYQHNEGPVEPDAEDSVSPRLEPYIAETFGEIRTVFHEVVSDGLHVDIYVTAPTESAKYFTLVTSGMSQRPMKPPKGLERFRLAELVMCLPAEWPLEESELANEEYYWPIRCLKTLARFPHQDHTCFNFNHTIPNGNPPRPYAPNTELCCALLSPIAFLRPLPLLTLEKGRLMEGGRWINFLHVIPIYEAEMNYVLKHGPNRLLGKMYEEDSLTVINPARTDYCRKKAS